MASLDLLRRHLFAAAAVIGMLLGAIIGLFLPIRAAAPPKAGSEAWSLPSVADTQRFREDAYATLRAARFWKSVAIPGQRAAPKLEWTLTAIITRPRQMAVVAQVGGGQGRSASGNPPSSMVAVGAELPDGATLVRLTRDAIWFEKDGCLRERRLYRAITAENNSCFGESASSASDPKRSATPKPTTAPASTGPSTNTAPAPTPQPARPAPQAGGSATP